MGRGLAKHIMKNFVSKSVTLIMIVAFLGCSSDSSDSSNPDCTPIPCYNGGISNANCGCNCPDGYGGSDCSNALLPLKIFISKIRITKFPNSSGGIDDLGTNPDLFIKLIKDNINLYESPTYFSDANGDGTKYYDYTFSVPIESNIDSAVFTLELWDYDTTSDSDLMGNVIFSPYLNFTGFPSSFIAQDITKKYTAEIFVIYQW